MIYKASVVGLGGIGAAYPPLGGRQSLEAALNHSDAYARHPRVQLMAGCDPDGGRRNAFTRKFGAQAHGELAAMLEREKPDLVSICSPDELHFQHVLECLEGGVRMIFLEKPPAGNVAEMETLEKAAKSKGATVLVNYQRRYANAYRRLKEACQRGTHGAIRHIHVTYSRGLGRNGSHLLDQCFFLMDDPDDYRLVSVFRHRESNNPSFAWEIKGVPVLVAGIDVDYHCCDIVVTFEAGRMAIVHSGSAFITERKIENPLFPGFYILESDSAQSGPTEDNSGLFARAIDDLLAACETGRAPESSLGTAKRERILSGWVTDDRQTNACHPGDGR